MYIVNVHPSKKDIIPTDYDEVNDRVADITYSDRNSRSETVTHLVTDYNELEDISNDFIELMYKLKGLMKNQFTNTSESITFQNELKRLLITAEEKSKARKDRRIKYKALTKGKFKLNHVVRIERTSDIDASAGKEAGYSSKPIDFTYESIKKLIEQGVLKLFGSIHISKDLFHIGIRS